MKPEIKINFVDFWPGMDPKDNYFFNIIKEDYTPIISPSPDYLFYSVFGTNNTRYNCTKISYIGENIAPIYKDSNLQLGSDYSFSFEKTDERNYRLPHYVLYPEYYKLTDEKEISEDLFYRDFASFVVSNGGTRVRNDFFIELSKYKKVSSGGRYQNNIGYVVGDKLEFLKKFKFNICFENDAYRGYNNVYTTEKLPQALFCKTIPIYFGNKEIGKEFNPSSFLDLSNFSGVKDLIEYIIFLDKTPSEYLKILNSPAFLNNQVPQEYHLSNIKKFLYNIFQKN